jgi:hydroxymethylbilane synthase
MIKTLRIGTRGSPLALIQAEEVCRKLRAAHPGFEKNFAVEIVPIRTSGDWKPEQREKRFIDLDGNKGLFTKEIEEALLGGQVDMAVHSMKDVAGQLPGGLEVAALLARLDPRDAFIGRAAATLDALPAGASVGTSSLRRQAQILARRPDLRVVPLRGNVDTRLRKLADDMADATLLAVAGLERLGARDKISSIMGTDVMLPSPAQGAIGIEIRHGDKGLRELLTVLNDPPTSVCVGAERAFLRVLDGSCKMPAAALAQLMGKDEMTLDALVAKPDGSAIIRRSRKGDARDFAKIGEELGREIRDAIPPGFFKA